jgi:FkbM family methyltransferase
MKNLIKAAAVIGLSSIRSRSTLRLLKTARQHGYDLPLVVKWLDPNTLRRYRTFKPRPVPLVESQVAGVAMRLDLNDHIQYRAYLHGSFDDVPIACALATCDEQTEYIDVGANIGTTSIPVAARLIPTICIEASIGTIGRLAANARLNALGPFTMLQVAASDTPGQLQLHVPATGNDGAASVYADWNRSARDSHVETVAAVCVDAVVASLPDRPVGCVKIDVEGHEIAVIQGMQATLRRHRPAVVFEWRVDLMEHSGMPVIDPRPLFPEGYQVNAVSLSSSGELQLAPFDPHTMYENAVAVDDVGYAKLCRYRHTALQ